jgi:hypothetical protein
VAEIMKFNIFWDIIPCNLLHSCQRFGGIFCLHLQGKNVSDAGKLLYGREDKVSIRENANSAMLSEWDYFV